jgi:hypothetical protein
MNEPEVAMRSRLGLSIALVLCLPRAADAIEPRVEDHAPTPDGIVGRGWDI